MIKIFSVIMLIAILSGCVAADPYTEVGVGYEVGYFEPYHYHRRWDPPRWRRDHGPRPPRHDRGPRPDRRPSVGHRRSDASRMRDIVRGRRK